MFLSIRMNNQEEEVDWSGSKLDQVYLCVIAYKCLVSKKEQKLHNY